MCSTQIGSQDETTDSPHTNLTALAAGAHLSKLSQESELTGVHALGQVT